jgi:hypothetical protein
MTVTRIAPDLPLAEQVKIEALAHCRRQEMARQLSATIKGPGAQAYRLKDRFKALADEIDREDAAERRRAEADRLRSPSRLIADALEKWPAQTAAVQQLADKRGIGLGEAWALVIDAGVEVVGEWEA